MTRRPAPSCHAPAPGGAGGPASFGEAGPVVALVGSPNVGKSSLFNAATGARSAVGNWPGTTVAVARGRWRLDPSSGGADAVRLLDLPGAYSLDPLSPDEALTRDLLDGAAGRRPDLVVAVASAADLGRTLYLVRQVREREHRLVVALTMDDVAVRRGVRVDVPELAAALGVPVVAVDARAGVGAALPAAVGAALAAPPPVPVALAAGADPEHPDADDPDGELARADERFAWVEAVVGAAVTRTASRGRVWSDRLDALVTAPVAGPLALLAVMWVVFRLTTGVAAPLQSALAALVSGPVSTGARAGFAAGGLGGTWGESLVVDGLVAGVGAVLSFVPVMVVMFALLAFLEDCGYLARAAVVTDRAMALVGLPGRAFLPLVVGFGCNVPAVAATRVLPHARQRLLTVLLVPFTSCSARLTVYVLVGSAFFGERAGDVVFGMYVLSVGLVVLGGLLLRSTLVRGLGHDPLVIDLPAYHLPAPRLLATTTWVRLAAFVRSAGGVIVVAVCAVWLLSALPAGAAGPFGRVAPADSVFGRTAATVAPVFAPAGFGDPTVAGALVVGAVAKEAVVSSWAQTVAAERPAGTQSGGAAPDLATSLRADLARSSGGHPTAAALAFLVFLLGYTPCVATLAAQRHEIGLRWTAAGAAFQLALAWTLAVGVFQVGSRLGGLL